MTNDDVSLATDEHVLVGAYVVNALSDDERRAFETHLSTCADCRAEVAELGEPLVGIAAELAAVPPAALRTSILAAIKQTPQEPVLPRRALTAVPPIDDPVPSAAPPVLDELTLRRSRRLTRGLALAVAAAAVLAIGLGGWVINLNQQRGQQVAAQQVEQQRYTDLLAAPDAKVYTQDKNGARYSFVVSKSRNEALFLGTGLPNPGSGNVYQLWTVGSGPLVDNSVTGSGSVRQWFRGPVGNSAGLAVNIEPASGPPGPNQPSTAILSSITI